MNRRGFMQGVIAAAMAPAFVSAASLMPVTRVWVPKPAPMLFPKIGSGLSDLYFVALGNHNGLLEMDRLPAMFAEKNGTLVNLNRMEWNVGRSSLVETFQVQNAHGEKIIEGGLLRPVAMNPHDHAYFLPSSLTITLD